MASAREPEPVGIVGANTRVGAELARLCSAQPWLELLAQSDEPRGPGANDAAPALTDLVALPAGATVFLAVRRGRGQELALALLSRGMRVIDLSGDHLLDEDDYAEAHPELGPHRHPRLIARAVAGLPSVGAALRGARLIAMPSPGAAAALLALAPLAEAGLISTDRVIVFLAGAASAAAGAPGGEAGGTDTGRLHDALRFEIGRALRNIAPGAARVSCAALGAPMSGGPGLIAIAMADLAASEAAQSSRLRAAYQALRAEAIEAEPIESTSVRLCAEGEFPDARRVLGTGAAEVSALGDAWAERVTAACALDPVPWSARAALGVLRGCTTGRASG